MMKRILILLVVVAGGFVAWNVSRRSQPPVIPVTAVKRETVVSTVVTNGKAEPLEWIAVRSEREGAVERVLVEKGQPIQQGAVLVELNATGARSELATAQARITQVRAEMESLERGGRSADLVEIQNSLTRAQTDLESARREYEAIQRLAAKDAATKQQVEEARRAVDKSQLEIRALENRRAALVGKTDHSIAEARLKEAEAAAEAARRRIEQAFIRAPIEGIAYQLDTRPGAYLNPGSEVAHIGKLHRMRVIVYVDEPELGRVDAGMPVTITWDAVPGRQWKGAVEKVPTQVVPLGSRQVGEVVCVIDNPDRELAPGANVNAEIRSKVAENVLVVPKEVIRRESNVAGVYVLVGDRLQWRPVQLGVSSVTRTQIVSGIAEGDRVAMPTDRPLSDGMQVRVTS
jgi:HlyD family secretion protein